MKGIVLFSSGIDSPVASYLASEKGLEIIGLNFYSKVLDEEYKNKIIELAKIVGIKKIYFADHNITHEAYTKNCNPRYQCVFCKRIMTRVADKLCDIEKCSFILNGDNIAQVATQTIPNLRVVSFVTDKMILRPILTFDKNEVINIARKIGTYDINLKFKGGCSYLPNNPATTSSIDKIKIEESKIDINALINKIVAGFIITRV